MEHLYDRGGMGRLHLRRRENILKRLVVHSGAANLGLLMRKLFGKGTPRGLAGTLSAIISAVNTSISSLVCSSNAAPKVERKVLELLMKGVHALKSFRQRWLG
jgi:hypothetical protein